MHVSIYEYFPCLTCLTRKWEHGIMKEEQIHQIPIEKNIGCNDENNAKVAGENSNTILTPKTIEIFTGFAATLKRIHIRLIMEGYTIKDGKIYKPGEYKEYEAGTEHNSRNK